jgi:hypothetical protein
LHTARQGDTQGLLSSVCKHLIERCGCNLE